MLDQTAADLLTRLTVVAENLEKMSADHELRLRDLESLKAKALGFCALVAVAGPMILFIVKG